MEKINDTFKYLEMNKDLLTPTQVEFIKSLRNYFKSNRYLTPRQFKCLEDIRKYMKVPEASVR
jgi:hypothetical protein